MSLINQMLQDLEKRRASSSERGALPNQVRPLPHATPAAPPWKWLGVAGLLVIAAAAMWQQRGQPHEAAAPELIQPASRLDYDLERVPSRRVLDRKKATASATEQPLSATAPVASAVPSHIAEATPLPEQPSSLTARPIRSLVIDGKRPAPSRIAQIDKQVHELTPEQQAENEYRQGVELLNQSRLPEAQDALTLALFHSPAHAAARQTLFGLLLNLKKYDEAERVLQEGLTLNPAQPGFARALASLQATRGDIPAAIETLRATEASAQNNADYLAYLAGLLQRVQRHDEAAAHYQAALKLTPQSGVWWMGLGISLQALNRNTEARDAFTHAKATSSLTPELQAFVDQRLKQVQ